MPTEAEPRNRAEKLGTGYQAESGIICGSEVSQKTSGRCRMGVGVIHKLKVRLGEGSLDRKYVMMG